MKYNFDSSIIFIQGNAEELPYKDASFDVVYHFGGINFFNSKKAILERFE
ncbi:methyltransferase domain-containing protein [Natranaerobius trueperi]